MKIIGIFLASLICLQLFACKTNEETKPTNVNPTITSISDTITNNKKMEITIRNKIFIATFNDNATAAVLKTMLPLNLAMTDLNNNEKKFDLSVNLPTNIEEIGTIHEGDILLWGNNTIVLFYKSFNTPYRYTKIGKINDTNGLPTALGGGDIKVSFEIGKD